MKYSDALLTRDVSLFAKITRRKKLLLLAIASRYPNPHDSLENLCIMLGYETISGLHRVLRECRKDGILTWKQGGFVKGKAVANVYTIHPLILAAIVNGDGLKGELLSKLDRHK